MANGDKRYKLSTDATEMDRLAVQHKMWCLLVGDLYPPYLRSSVDDLLDSNGTHYILDVGCGPGIWAMEMAERFPKAEVIGFDLTQQKYSGNLPNFSFVQGDLAHGFPSSFRDKFDIIHCRCVAQHVQDPQGLVQEIALCLRPGGLLILADGDWVAFDQNTTALAPVIWDPNTAENEQAKNSQGSWYGGWLNLFGQLTRSREYEPIDTLVRSHGRFSEIDSNSYFSPINWSGEGIENGREIGEIMNKNMREFFEGGIGPMVEHGLSHKIIDIWRQKFEEELDHHLYNVWYLTSARKS